MSESDEKWQWVDEDPIERLLRAPPPPDDRTEPAPESPERVCLADGTEQSDRLGFEEALGSYASAVAADPNSATAHFDLAVCLEKTEQWSAAVTSFRKALEIDPEHAQAMIGLGACLLHLDDAAEALDCFEHSSAAGADREAVLFGKAVALQKLQRYEEADAVYRELLRLDPNLAEPLANLIALSIAREDWTATYKYSRRLLRVEPRAKAALQGLVTLAIRSGDREVALEYCTRLVEVDPDSFEGRFNLRFAQQNMSAAEQPTRSIA
jgi:protein O-GlcNAc transferase